MSEPLSSWAILGLVVAVFEAPLVAVWWHHRRRDRAEARRRNMARPMRPPR